MKALIAVLAFGFAATAAGPTPAADLAGGKKLFGYWCGTCHGVVPGEDGRPLPGTASLQVKYGGAKPPLLEERDDLIAAYVKIVVRKGSKGMPFFRKTEISDSQMDDIAVYLARNTK